MKRNLLFYLYPVRNSIWPWHVEQLRRHWGVWNGRKLIVLAMDGATEDEWAVRKEFSGLDCEMTVTENDPKQGETKTFVDHLASLESDRLDEITFYAHGKGVSRKPAETANILAWCWAMYHMNLSDAALIDAVLGRYEAVGCFRFEFPHAGSWWHFAGTYFWFRHEAVFKRQWRSISSGPHGVESYLGLHVPWERSYCLTPPTPHFMYDRPVQHQDVVTWMAKQKETWVAESAGSQGR